MDAVNYLGTAGYTCYHCKAFVPAGHTHTCPVGFSNTVNGHICDRCGAFVLNHAFHSCGGIPPAPACPVAAPTGRQLRTIVTALRVYQDTPSLLPAIRALVADAPDWAQRAEAAR